MRVPRGCCGRGMLTTDCVGCRDSVDYASDRSHWDNDPASPCTSQTGRSAACSALAVCTWQRRGGGGEIIRRNLLRVSSLLLTCDRPWRSVRCRACGSRSRSCWTSNRSDTVRRSAVSSQSIVGNCSWRWLPGALQGWWWRPPCRRSCAGCNDIQCDWRRSTTQWWCDGSGGSWPANNVREIRSCLFWDCI